MRDEDGGVVRLPIRSLRPATSPRLKGESPEHVRALAGVIDSLPPIIVHQPTMRIVDGMHRVRAAVERGETTIVARLFDGTENEAFVLAVRENVGHGLPLSLADRKAAAGRIIADNPAWSDRSVAAVVGLAPSSVGLIRKRSTDRPGQLNSRIGRDGRARPMDAAERRRRVAELFTAEPAASLRQVAREAQVSVGTAHTVRRRMLAAGELPVALPGRPAVESAPARRSPPADRFDWPALRQQLRADPALRYAESGRRLLQWLDAHAIGPDEWVPVVESVPPHWQAAIVNLAHQFAQEWREFAKQVRQGGEEAS